MTTASHPLVSVIIRSSGRDTLADALASIDAQTYPAIEAVIVNAVGDKHGPLPAAGKHPHRFINGDGKLQRSRAANKGLESANGDFIVFLDDDDWFQPEHIASLVARLEEHPDAIAAYSGVECIQIDANGGRHLVRVFNEAFDATRLLVENTIPMHALLFRRSAIDGDSACRFDPEFDLFEDWDFWLQLLTHGNFVHHPEVTAVYRIHANAGAGVAAEQETANAALDAILNKWRSRWTTEQLRSIAAQTRLMRNLLNKANAHIDVLDKEIDGVRGMLDETNQALAAIERTWYRRLARLPGALKRKAATAARIWREGDLRELIWRLLINIYRMPFANRVLVIVPFTVKRRIRDYFSRAQKAPEIPAFSGRLSDNPKVSIVIPVYQHAEYIEACIRSALAQTYANLEVIVVDDASPDPRVGQTLAYLEGSPRLILLRNEKNLGISGTQNRALLASTGEIIAFLDCDDLLMPDAVETSLRYWNENTVYSHSARINVNEQDEEINRVCFQHLPRSDYFAENLAAMYATHFKMIRRDVFARLGLFDSRFDAAQDYDYLMRVAAHYDSSAFAYVPHFVYHHRLHGKQTTEVASTRQAAAVQQIKREATMRRDIQNGRFDRKLSFIMLSFGKQSQTLEAIQSLKRTVKVPHEIILFDNGSDPETVAFLKSEIEGKFDDLRVYYSDTNLGPAAGRRVALGYATGDWFIIFDNDELAEPGWLEEMLVRACSDDRIGIVTGKVIFPNRRLQCSGGYLARDVEDLVHLQLFDRGEDAFDLSTAQFRDCDWCPIGATLFTVNPAPYLHAGYPNIFEDAGVSFAFKRLGYRLVNSPASWVWHEHVTFRKNVEMGDRYNRERYNPQRMLLSVASFYHENALLIHDEYVWRENHLDRNRLDQVRLRLGRVIRESYPAEAVQLNSGKPLQTAPL